MLSGTGGTPSCSRNAETASQFTSVRETSLTVGSVMNAMLRLCLNCWVDRLSQPTVQLSDQRPYACRALWWRILIPFRSDYVTICMTGVPIRHSGEGRNPENPISKNSAASHRTGISIGRKMTSDQRKDGPLGRMQEANADTMESLIAEWRTYLRRPGGDSTLSTPRSLRAVCAMTGGRAPGCLDFRTTRHSS